jgi:hypothetical protein
VANAPEHRHVQPVVEREELRPQAIADAQRLEPV